MESKANTTAIGIFTLGVLGLAFAFIYWLARADEAGSREEVTVVFSGPVTGLSKGSQVLFNGIKVGDVTSLALNVDNPREVVAKLAVMPDAPVKADTRVGLSYQGLTGVAFVDLKGGSADVPRIWEVEDEPVLRADSVAVQDVLEGARGLMGRADNILTTVSDLVRDSSPRISNAVVNIERLSSNLAGESESLVGFAESASKAAESLARLSDSLIGTARRTEEILAAVEPSSVGTTVENVRRLSQDLADRAGEIETFVTQLNAISSNVLAFTTQMQSIGTKTEAFVDTAGARANALLEAVDPEVVEQTVAKLGEVASAIEADKLQRSIRNIELIVGGLSSQRENIDKMITDLSGASGDVAAFTGRLAALGDRAEAVAGAVDPEALSRVVTKIDEIAGVLDAQRIAGTVENVARVSETVAGQSAQIETALANASAITEDVKAFTPQLPEIAATLRKAADDASALVSAVDAEAVNRTVTGVGEAVAAVDPARLRQTMTNIGTFSDTLAAQNDQIGRIVEDAGAIAGDIREATPRLKSLANSLADTSEKTGQLVSAIDPKTVNRTVTRIGDVVASVDRKKVKQSVDDVSQFAAALGEGSDDMRQILADARAVSGRLNNLTEKAEALLTKLDGLAGEGGGDIVGDVRVALQSVRDAARSFEAQAESIGGQVSNFSGRSLKDIENLVRQGQRAVGRLDRVIGQIEDNPGQFLFGGSRVPEYRGSRRR